MNHRATEKPVDLLSNKCIPSKSAFAATPAPHAPDRRPPRGAGREGKDGDGRQTLPSDERLARASTDPERPHAALRFRIRARASRAMLDPLMRAHAGRPWDAATAEVRPHRVSGSRAEIGNVRGTIPSVRKATQEPRHRDAQGLLQRLRLRMKRAVRRRFVARARSLPTHATQTPLTRHQVHYDTASRVEPRLVRRRLLTSTREQRVKPS
ncbi:hypothetical protein AAG906_024558 [Vitis piasezkii]